MLVNGRELVCICYGLFLLAVVIGQPGCSKQPDQAEVNRYIEEIETQRAMKDLQFKKGHNSPLTAAGRQNFQQLHYFPVDYNYRVSARYMRSPAPEQFAIQTSSGRERTYVRVGRLEFKINGTRYTLMTYQDRDEVQQKRENGHLFVPFTDATSGRDSYGGGRYLDIGMPKGESITIDFNLAYNPYCAYNPGYSCPIPPRENHLQVEIVAGEKTFK